MNKKAVIFDMDGVLIDSEPLWQQAQIEALSVFGISITAEQCIHLTMGKRIDEIAKTWISLYSIGTQPNTLETMILKRLCRLIEARAEAMPGVYDALQHFNNAEMKIALATSSTHQVIEAVFSRLKLWDYFSVVCSAEDELFGKPHPDVYLTALRKLELEAEDCIVIEDSFAGMTAAKAANIETYVISTHCQQSKFAPAEYRYTSLPSMLNDAEILCSSNNKSTLDINYYS